MNFTRLVNPAQPAAGHHHDALRAAVRLRCAELRRLLSPQVFINLLIDNSFLLVVAVGMTFVIISGGIDLSVGSIVALTTP